MPLEHEIPAPVTTTIFLHFATDSERLDNVRRVEGSEAHLSRWTVVTMFPYRMLKYRFQRGQCRWWIIRNKKGMSGWIGIPLLMYFHRVASRATWAWRKAPMWPRPRRVETPMAITRTYICMLSIKSVNDFWLHLDRIQKWHLKFQSRVIAVYTTDWLGLGLKELPVIWSGYAPWIQKTSLNYIENWRSSDAISSKIFNTRISSINSDWS